MEYAYGYGYDYGYGYGLWTMTAMYKYGIFLSSVPTEYLLSA